MRMLDWRVEIIMKEAEKLGEHLTPEEASDMISSGKVEFGLPKNYLETGVTEREGKPRPFGFGSNARGPDEVNL